MKYTLKHKFLINNKFINVVIFFFSLYLGLLLIEFFIHFYLDKRQVQNNFPTIYEYLQDKDLNKYQPYNLPQEIKINKKIYFL